MCVRMCVTGFTRRCHYWFSNHVSAISQPLQHCFLGWYLYDINKTDSCGKTTLTGYVFLLYRTAVIWYWWCNWCCLSESAIENCDKFVRPLQKIAQVLLYQTNTVL